MKAEQCKFIALILFFAVVSLVGCICKEVNPEKMKTKFIKVDGCNIGYKTLGKGYPLVMIMGYGGTMEMWDTRVLKMLAKNNKVIIFDNRGMGESTATDKEFSVKLFADDTAGLLKALNIEKTNVLGYSMGAYIALELTLKHPEMVNKLVLYAGKCGGEEAIKAPPENTNKLTDTSGTFVERSQRLLPLFISDEWIKDNPDYVKYLPKVTKIPSTVIIDRQTKALLGWEGCYNRLSEITNPVLAITGTKDVIVPPGNSLILVNHIPSAWLVQINGGGHGMMYQYPRKISEVILAFLDI